jgi:hypothetical protein
MAVKKLTDNEAADVLINTATSVYSEPGIAWRNLQETKFRLAQAQAHAEGMTGRSFDSDRVSPDSAYDFADRVGDIISLETAVASAETAYFCAMASFRYCLERAKEIGVFDGFQAAVWRAYYEHGSDAMSLQQLADRFHVTKSRIQYLVTSTRAKAAFCRAIDSVINDINFASDTDDGVCIVKTGNEEDNLELIDLGDFDPCSVLPDENNDGFDTDTDDDLGLPDFSRI